jgi:hypothetical protein
MSDIDIETSDLGEVGNIAKPPTQRRPEALARRVRPRGLVQQLVTVLMRPVTFFQTLAPAGETRQWLVVALLLLALVGVGAVRHHALTSGAGGAGDVPITPDMGGGGDIPLDPSLGGDPNFGGIPPGVDPNAGGGAVGGASSTTDDLTRALLAGADVVIGWFILAVLLLVVPMSRGNYPNFGMGLQVAVWASVPLGVMAALQLLYYASGGQAGAAGLTGLLPEFDWYTAADPSMQAVLLSLAGKATVFWLWSAVLVYHGARHALNGARWMAIPILIVWVGVQVMLPVATGAVRAPEVSAVAGEMPLDPSMGGGMPLDPSMGGGEPMPEGEVEMGDEVPLNPSVPPASANGGG